MKVGVIGASGRMGRETCATILAAQDMELVFGVDHKNSGNLVAGTDLRLTNDLIGELLRTKPDAVVDFTHPSSAAAHAVEALRAGAIPIIGTSGLSDSALEAVRNACDETGLPALYIPNFAIGAVLMMKFAAEAAKHLPEAQIIEMHHDRKVDAPSGTAIRTAELIASNRARPPKKPATEVIKVDGAVGGTYRDTPIHSVRLPGLVAHQLVLFGGPGEVLTIRHDSLDRSSFMQGVLLALRKCKSLTGLVIGLENLLDN